MVHVEKLGNGACIDTETREERRDRAKQLAFTKQPTLDSKYYISILYSGQAPLDLSLEVLESQGFSASNPLPPRHAHNVTVPGAAAGWVDTVDKFGSGKVRRLQSNTT